MYRYLMAAVTALLLVSLAPGDAWGQAGEVGRIDRIAEVLGGRRERLIKQASERVQAQNAGSTTWANLAPDAQVLDTNRLRVERFTDVRLRVQRPSHRGFLIFLPELLERNGNRAFPAPAQGTPVREALYSLNNVSGNTQDLVVSIQQGALVVDWVHGRLEVVAAGTRTVITGTRLAVEADPGDDTGTIFLETGTINFPDYPDVQVAAGQVIRLRRGLPPELGVLTPAALSAAQSSVRYHARGVWSRANPFWTRPGFYVPALGVAAGGVAWTIATLLNSDPPTHNGEVYVVLPPSVR
jgi:hypothetical protein